MKFIKPEIVLTADGSHSLFLADIDEHYHSHHGAVQESEHVYIDMGLNYVRSLVQGRTKIFELGFGTGLNAFLTAAYAEKHEYPVVYHSVELHPVDPDLVLQMNYSKTEEHKSYSHLFEKIHRLAWNAEEEITPNFKLQKIHADFLSLNLLQDYNLIYFDAFGFRAQSEMWSEIVFKKCFDLLLPSGVLVTYASKGIARRAMEAVGFKVERLKGAPGKREMMRAIKPSV